MRTERVRPRRTLVVMVKAPLAGRVKTRLAEGIGSVAATGFYRHALVNLIARLTAPRRWTCLLAVAPDSALKSAALPGRTARLPQGSGDLGHRMQRVFDRLSPAPVLIIGSDVPGIGTADISEAFRRLEGHDAVVGPSPDGGYWLIGLNRRRRRLMPFSGVPWSTAGALAGTLANLPGCRIARLQEKADIDDVEDWRRARALRDRRIIAPGS